jgi:hypothetical protein
MRPADVIGNAVAQSPLIDPDQCALAAICDADDVISQMRAHAFGVRL